MFRSLKDSKRGATIFSEQIAVYTSRVPLRTSSFDRWKCPECQIAVPRGRLPVCLNLIEDN